MTVELITGFAGTPHIGSDDVGAYNAGLVGPGDYALTTGDQLAATMSDATTFALKSGDAVLNGRHVHLSGTTTATVTAGTSGQKRNDLAVLRYTRNTTTNIESCSLVVIKGTSTTGTPADPTYNTGSILDGVATHDMPLYRIPIDGITVGTPVPLFNILKPMKDVWDSLTPIKLNAHDVFTGLPIVARWCAGVLSVQIHGTKVLTKRDKATIIGRIDAPYRPANPVRAIFGVTNGSWGIMSVEPSGEIAVIHRYGADTVTWDYVDISVTSV